ncbi:hypothetical protein Tco_1146683 [Tanacetum coccineum]
MLNKDNYVLWSSRLLRYAKSKPNGKLLANSIKNGPYVRRMIHELDDPNNVPSVDESTHKQINDELTEIEVKQMEIDDQAIQTILIVQNVRNRVVQNAVQNLGAQNVGNQNRLIVVLGIAYPNVNQHGNGDLDEIEEVNANRILMANLQQASTSCT